MLEKYKKLAHDASLNGDRVQTEYYLQFADHYFRVIADMRAQKEEQRPRREHDRDNDREQSFDDDFDEVDEADRGRERPARRDTRDEAPPEEGERAIEGEEVEVAEADDNPFTRDTRGRGSRSRNRNRPTNGAEPAAEADENGAIDAGILPPSIARDEEAPRRASTRRRRPRNDEGGEEALEAVS